MRYVPYDRLDESTPSIIVDGTGTRGTRLVLSHWVGAGTPEPLKDDLSTQIAFRYLDAPEMHVEADAVSNNHFDEDGLCGIYAIVNPDDAAQRREMLVAVAAAGDFGVVRSREAARIAMALTAYADDKTSPLGAAAFAALYPQVSAALHEATLPLLPDMLDHPDRYRALWEESDARLQETLDALETGGIKIDERPELDLAIVRADTPRAPHEMAINTATQCFRVLTLHDDRPSLRYRYETWVEYRSRPAPRRRDAKPLAQLLASEDSVEWRAGDVGELTPTVAPSGPSSLAPDRVAELVAAFFERE